MSGETTIAEDDRGDGSAAAAGADRRPRGTASAGRRVPALVRAAVRDAADADTGEGSGCSAAESPRPAGSATATAGTHAIAKPIPSATAKAPTRPTWRADDESETTNMADP